MFIPFVTGGSLYAYGKLGKDDRAVAASFAVLQSSLIAFLYNSLLKAITGRPNPDWQHHSDMKELSKTFRFGFMRGGIFWGWPSGHTSSTMAVVSSLTSFYADKTWLKIAGYSLVAYMMYGVTSLHRGGMHWFSDAVAAAFMSYAIGSTVGKYYRSKFQPGENSGETPPGMEMPLLNIRFVF
jgi:membrane-associated phospholipid phosphatase